MSLINLLERGQQCSRMQIERYVELFKHRHCSQEQLLRMDMIREAAKTLATAILKHTPHFADKMDAIRKLRECLQMANASISLEGFNL